jgi:transposase
MPPTSGKRTASTKVCGGDWSTYNERATREIPEVLSRIRSACDAIRLPRQRRGRGNAPFPLRSLLKCWLAMGFLNLASRRAVGFLRTHRRDLGLRAAPHFNTLTRRAHGADVPRLLQDLLERLRQELGAPEREVSTDSTGVAMAQGKRWIDARRGAGNDWRKLHTAQDVETGLIVAAEVTDARTHDSLIFPALVGGIKPGATVLADRAYLSRENVALVEDAGGIAHIRPKKNTTIVPWGRDPLSRLARRAKRRAWWKTYYRRASHESRFSAIKRMIKPILRWKKETGQITELLLAALIHNLRVLAKWVQ